MTIALIVVLILSIPGALITLLAPLYFKFEFGKTFFHNILGWHLPKKKHIKQEGVNLISQCRLCGREIMQDSQGNWFSYGDKR